MFETERLAAYVSVNIFEGHGIYQLTIMFIIIFAGEKIWDIESGRGLEHNAAPTQHYTIVFNVFVLMQVGGNVLVWLGKLTRRLKVN